MNTANSNVARQTAANTNTTRDAVVAEHLPLVNRIAKKISHRVRGKVEMEELVAWGTTGLLEAMDRYQEGSEATLATFAYLRIRGAMLDGIGKVAPLSRKDYRRAGSRGDFHAIYAAAVETNELADPRSDLSPEDFASRKEVNAELMKAIAKLPEQQRTLVMDHYFGDATLQESGKTLGISKSWASRAHAKALANLREEMQSAVALAA